MLIPLILLAILWQGTSQAMSEVSQNNAPSSSPALQFIRNCAPVDEGKMKQMGKVLTMSLSEDPQQAYYLYIPRSGGVGQPVFVTVHGISRNALEHAQSFAPFAEKYGVVLIAPLFTADRFPKYQRLESGGSGGNPDVALQRIIAEVGKLTCAKTDKIFLFGYSGGGQFTHRYAMRYPGQVARFVVGAAGWYTFPLNDKKYPYGIKTSPDLPDLSFDPAKFLTIPGTVVVGERDNKQGSALNKSQKIDDYEGDNRLERGREWIDAMAASARDRGLSTPYFFEIMPHCGHSFDNCMKRGNMGAMVFEHLFPSADKQATNRQD
jgi:pimeloyl-ACP methyl ester carboxylesterase